MGRYSLAGVSVAHALLAWLAVVAWHVGLDECVSAAAAESLSNKLQLAFFGCTKYGAAMFNGKPWAVNSWEIPVSWETGGKSLSLGTSRVTGISRGSGNSRATEIPVFSRP